MDSLLRRLKWSNCLCYLDDVVVLFSTLSEHLHRLNKFLGGFRVAGQQINSKKCTFAAGEIKVLGDILSSKGIRPDPYKFRTTDECPTPSNVKYLRSFIGLSGHL